MEKKRIILTRAGAGIREITLEFAAISRSTFGGGCAKLYELRGNLTASKRYQNHWERQCINLAELARLRWVEKWSPNRIAAHLSCTKAGVCSALRRHVKDPGKVGGG